MRTHYANTDPTRIDRIEQTLVDLSTQVAVLKRQNSILESNIMEIKGLIQERDPATDEDFRNEFKANGPPNYKYDTDTETSLLDEVKASGLPLNDFLRQAEEMLAKAQGNPNEYRDKSDEFTRTLEELEHQYIGQHVKSSPDYQHRHRNRWINCSVNSVD